MGLRSWVKDKRDYRRAMRKAHHENRAGKSGLHPGDFAARKRDVSPKDGGPGAPDGGPLGGVGGP